MVVFSTNCGNPSSPLAPQDDIAQTFPETRSIQSDVNRGTGVPPVITAGTAVLRKDAKLLVSLCIVACPSQSLTITLAPLRERTEPGEGVQPESRLSGLRQDTSLGIRFP